MRSIAIVALVFCSGCALMKGAPPVTDISSRHGPGRSPLWTRYVPCAFQRDTSKVRVAVDSACVSRRDTLTPAGDPEKIPGEKLP
jgi:hypothetical protein